ncbi:UNVERIFIED_CONTAM: hypothetical protein HDU68_006281 [Siphonaria sp. JEL0065]|nr:hypothetical protein HDU68_006281 [Siphonaria sp. JEL0065]
MVQAVLQLEGIASLSQNVALAWATDVNGTGSRVFGSVAQSEKIVGRGQLVLDGLWSEDQQGSIDVVTLEKGISLMSVTGLVVPERMAALAVALVELFQQQNIATLSLVASLNVSQKGSVLYAGINNEKVPLPHLDTSLPLNDRFLGALVPSLHCTSINTTLIAIPTKKERHAENGRLLQGMNSNSVDLGLVPLLNAAQNHLGIQFDAEKALNLLLPHVAVMRAKEDANLIDKKDDLLLMYL